MKQSADPKGDLKSQQNSMCSFLLLAFEGAFLTFRVFGHVL